VVKANYGCRQRRIEEKGEEIGDHNVGKQGIKILEPRIYIPDFG